MDSEGKVNETAQIKYIDEAYKEFDGVMQSIV